MSMGVIVLLILLGLLLVMMEILVIPGVGVVGIAGGVLIIVAIYFAYAIEAMYGHIALLSSLIASVLAIYFSLKSKTWRNATLNTATDGKVNLIPEETLKVGDRGITLSRLNAMGKARINDKIFEVESIKGFIDVQTEIEIVKLLSHKIQVKPV